MLKLYLSTTFLNIFIKFLRIIKIVGLNSLVHRTIHVSCITVFHAYVVSETAQLFTVSPFVSECNISRNKWMQSYRHNCTLCLTDRKNVMCFGNNSIDYSQMHHTYCTLLNRSLLTLSNYSLSLLFVLGTSVPSLFKSHSHVHSIFLKYVLQSS